MQSGLSEGVDTEEIKSEALKMFETKQLGFKDGFVRFLPSGQVNTDYSGWCVCRRVCIQCLVFYYHILECSRIF